MCNVSSNSESIFIKNLSVLSVNNNEKIKFLLKCEGRVKLLAILPLCQSYRNNIAIKSWLQNLDLRTVPLEFLCIIHEASFIQLTTFLYYHPTLKDKITKAVIEIISNDYSAELVYPYVVEVFLVTLKCLINIGDHSLRSLQVSASATLESICFKIINLIESGKYLNIDLIEKLTLDERLSPLQLKSFGSSLLSLLLVYDPPSVSLSETLASHHKRWLYDYLTNQQLSIFNLIYKLVGIEDFLNALDNALRDQQFNFKYLLSYTSFVCHQSSADQDKIKVKGEDWFKNGLNDKSEIHLAGGLILMRHHSAINSKYFVSYANWFGSIKIKSQAAYMFLIQFLSKMVPFEMRVFLKVHATKMPSPPANCSNILTDYLNLVKARLADLNETSEYMGLFSDFHETLDDQLESDINRVINHYLESKDIPKAVLEASVFRKNYYEKVFLPYLMKVEKKKDTNRVEVIKKLYSLGKIQSKVYRAWSRME